MIAALFFFLPVSSSLARSIALVVGNDTYTAIPSLQKARADADAVGGKLEALGFGVTVAHDLDRDAMSRALVALDAAIVPGDMVFFFYAGHGFAIDGENYLLPTDVPAAGPGEAELVRDASFAVSRIVERLQRRGARTAVLVLDACRNNPFARPGERSLAGSSGLARMHPPEGVFVLFSAGSGQAALDRLGDRDENKNSVFTRILLDNLGKPGLSLVRLAKETQIGVRALAASVGYDQTPAYYDQVIGDIVLSEESAAPEVEIASLPTPARPEDARLAVPPDPAATAGDFTRATLLYEQARAAEARGDALGARRAYLALIEENIAAVDPPLRFAALLRLEEGRAGARELLGSLRERFDNPSLALVHALQFDDAERRQRLADLEAAYPGYSLVHYQLAQEWSADRLGREPTLSERKRQANALGLFLQAVDDGRAGRYFIDKSVLATWADGARERLDVLSRDLQGNAKPSATFVRHNAGWSMTVILPEPATALFWRDGTMQNMEESGALGMTDPKTGHSIPNPMIPLPPDQEAGLIEIAYRDMNGEEIGPYPIFFDPENELFFSQKAILETLNTAWVETRDWANGYKLMYTTTLVSYNCAIREARYGLNGAAPTEPIPLPPCNQQEPGSIPSDFDPYLTIPGDTRNVTVQLTWYDGTESKISKITAK